MPAYAQTTLSSAQVTQLKRLTVTATRRAAQVLDVPASVSVVSAEDLEKRVVRDIQDLVRYQPGVSVDRQTAVTNPFGQLTQFNIRGMGGNRVQMTVDGSRVQERITDGSRDFVDPFNMKAVEIVRGPNSVLWGADALGGTVAFRTKDPSDLLDGQDKPWAVEIKTSFDSFDTSWRKQITAAYDFGDVQVLGSFGNLTSTEPKAIKADPEGGIWGCPLRPASFRCDRLFPADTSAYNGLAKVVWTPNADHEFKLTGEFFARETNVDQLWDPFAAAAPPSEYYTSDAYPRVLEMLRSRLAVSHDWQVGADWLDSVKWNLSYSPQTRDMKSTAFRTYANRQQIVEQIRNYSESFLEADLQLQSSFDAGDTFHTLTYGFDGDIMRGDYVGTNSTYNSLTGLTTVLENQGFSFPRTTTARADFFIQDEIKLFEDRLTVTPGIRIANYYMEPEGAYTGLPGYTPGPVSNTTLLKKLSVSYELDDTLSVFAAYGEGFKMPNAQQLFQSSQGIGATGFVNIIPNPNLQPESVQNFEVGLRGEYDQGWFSLGGFYAKYDNFIRSLQPVPGQPDTYWSDNVESVNLWGIEVAGEYEVYENIFASANVSWQIGRQQLAANAAETAFDGAVPLTAVLGVRYELPEHGLDFEVLGTFAAGPTERASATTFKPDGYAIFDAFGRWKPSENVEISFGVQNIFDTAYFPNTLTGYDTIQADDRVKAQNPLELQRGPGRTFKVGTTVRF
ncbi:TonB-dependent hemoglobin/transferrin/lactoferrin family receptor [Devosia sp. YIM 151766]|uniref:TonB-dependent hemoglobin/transferrin/lactoferrin family receptor n=1 Tax=Devosia sp. YIM 151766 TaxID=3017325 RepID=UPI00255CDDFA|nr:TonB-dependent hemoglobin/transferrin/lactoferrin family receptor [Devosia sp. YIM 151766]WIY54557.1 TonB-dependent hemoglobin/transferrin/lactoferrin family receptor [Devosia sp. YIM 151766]